MTEPDRLRMLMLALQQPPEAVPDVLRPAWDALLAAWTSLSGEDRRAELARVTPPVPVDMGKFYDETIAALMKQVTNLTKSKAALIAARDRKPIAKEIE